MKKENLNDSLESNDLLPIDFYLSQNYPNPFKAKTKIKYCIPYKTKVNITVFDPGGNKIETIVDEEKEAGTYEVEFNASKILNGICSCRLRTENFSKTKEMLKVK